MGGRDGVMEGGRDGVVLSEGRMGCKAGVAWFEMQERRLAGVVTLGVTGGGTGPGARGSWLCPQPVSPGSALAPLALTLTRLTREHGDCQRGREGECFTV